VAAKDLAALRDEAAALIAKGQLAKAGEAYAELEAREPTSPQWPKRLAETQRKLGNIAAAIAAFERASDKFVQDGMLVQAIAMCKLILQMEPQRASTIGKLAALATRPERSTRLRRLSAPPAAAAAAAPVPPAAATAAAPAVPDGGDVVAKLAAAKAAFRAAKPDVAIRPAPRPAPLAPTRTPAPAPAPRPAPAGAAPRAAAPPRLPPKPIPMPPATELPAPLLPPAPPLDAFHLSTLVRRAQMISNPDGSFSGITLLPIDDEVIEIELGDVGSGDSDEAAATDADFEWPSEVEIVEAAASPVRIELNQGARLALRDTPIFAKLPHGALERLIARMAFLQLAPDDLVFAEGDPGSTLYVIADGEVVVEATGRELARLGPGAFFGEIALVTELPRSASVRATSRVDLLAIDRDVVRDAIAEQPRIIDVLLAFVRDRLVDRVTRTSELFRMFTAVDRAQLSQRFELLEVDAGSPLLLEGQRADGLYVLLAGTAAVARGDRHLATLASGDVFGEASLLSNAPSLASVTAASRVLALRMTVATFREVMMTHPQLLAHLSELADARALAAEAAADEMPDMLDLHVDLL
jgi:CRP-like cAMP-binding protein